MIFEYKTVPNVVFLNRRSKKAGGENESISAPDGTLDELIAL
ncbi:hypothetical protein LEP1GSC103_2943 [Leptospira borgpetersenii serovar Javanica str. UI 09931]|uniref:Uncharacterized protein n=4 Tax=Leptospira borgpetersenii TaxID=174 RepID=M3GIU1_LEPBO|nr:MULTISPECIES: hypothetical protein [Leptospira]EKQ91804.1 hypothetical protein LEP1GSC101_3287 [Leptospira borgpetersenii str. UI 09149]EMG00882.1 hypothetical protein LEP1GSC123_4451 [Leptospira borgpetersenii str. 200701203]EMN14291.1 hypothetical protein LEP1GSC055_2383 [Leptospira borgpetersenii str. Brem 307]EMN18447.1 hypothetical protein LEP1GSC056_2282 [Leptospira borgpetersenii str. Brem 328]ENO62537.1 hypothetical protein LEP1GSC191_3735 [Leptospira borgpetersenii serovar Mini str